MNVFHALFFSKSLINTVLLIDYVDSAVDRVFCIYQVNWNKTTSKIPIFFGKFSLSFYGVRAELGQYQELSKSAVEIVVWKQINPGNLGPESEAFAKKRRNNNN